MDARIGLSQMIEEGLEVDCCISSPPYWALRDYNIKSVIWDGDIDCDHIWTDHLSLNILKEHVFCVYCGAWYGTLGLEPNFELYIKHLCDIYDQIKKVLKPTGTCWVNLGDSYGGATTERTNSNKKNFVLKFPKANDPNHKRRNVKGFQK